MSTRERTGPLVGLRVLELGSFIAGPFAGQLLGDYGADVIKVETPGQGDPMRTWGITHDGDGLWWPAIARNKRSVAIDMHHAAGGGTRPALAARVDVVLENFRPGRLEEWGLGYDALWSDNPGVIVVHVSGFGQTGPRAIDAGFGSIGEAMGGIRGNDWRPRSAAGPMRHQPRRRTCRPLRCGWHAGGAGRTQFSGRGQEVDVAIYEAVAALMESTLADFEIAGVTRRRTGGVLPGVAPSNAIRQPTAPTC